MTWLCRLMGLNVPIVITGSPTAIFRQTIKKTYCSLMSVTYIPFFAHNVVLRQVNGQKVTGQKVTKLLGQKVTICIHLDSCTVCR